MKAVMDTRFFINSLTTQDEQFKKWSKVILQTLQTKANLGIVPSIVIHEFYKFQLENLGREVAELRVNSLLKLDLEFVDFSVPIAIEAAKLRCKYGDLPTADAIIAATAILMGSDYIITDDKHIKQIKETKTKWI
jgi:predicted nucleic acid-binding protein